MAYTQNYPQPGQMARAWDDSPSPTIDPSEVTDVASAGENVRISHITPQQKWAFLLSPANT